MKLIIKTPEQLKSERAKLMDDAIELMRLYNRSIARYTYKINTIRNKIIKIEQQLGE